MRSCRELSRPKTGPEPPVRFVRHRFRQLSCPQTGLADIGFVGGVPGPSVLGHRPVSPAVGREPAVVPVQVLGIGEVQLAVVTEKTKASNQAGRALHYFNHYPLGTDQSPDRRDRRRAPPLVAAPSTHAVDGWRSFCFHAKAEVGGGFPLGTTRSARQCVSNVGGKTRGRLSFGPGATCSNACLDSGSPAI